MSTITKEFTKEQLIAQAQENVAQWHDAMQHNVNTEYAAIRLRLAEIALASLEAQTVDSSDLGAVKYEYTGAGDYYGYGFYRDGVQVDVDISKPLYTAPPAPVVPRVLEEIIFSIVNAMADETLRNDESKLFSLVKKYIEYAKSKLSFTMLDPKEKELNIYPYYANVLIDALDLLADEYESRINEARHPATIEHRKIKSEKAREFAAMLKGKTKLVVSQDCWVACSERMPELPKYWPDMAVIIAHDGEPYGTEALYCRDGEFRWGRDEEPVQDVTHWMPLPAAPKQEVK